MRRSGRGKLDRPNRGRYVGWVPDLSPIGAGPLLWRDDGGPLVDRQQALDHLAGRDPILGRLIGRVGPFTLEAPPPQSPFRYLTRAIVYQQLSGKAAATIYGRFATRVGRVTPARVLDCPVPALRGAGLSHAKTRAVKDLARHATGGTVPSRRRLHGLDLDAIRNRLVAVRGVGPWTVEMLLIFYLGCPDILPGNDLGIRKGFALTYGRRALPTPNGLARYGARWEPYRSMACWYLWRALEL